MKTAASVSPNSQAKEIAKEIGDKKIFRVDKKIFEQFPDLHIGVVIARNLNNSAENKAAMTLLHQQQEHIRTQYSLEALAENPQIIAWREAYTSFGAKPKKYKCSVENLYRMVLEGMDLRHINTAVDLYNYISLKYMVPMGGDDLDNVDEKIELQYASGEESFIPLNSDCVDNPKSGEIIYADQSEVLCRRWNWRECDKSKMTKDSKNISLVIEGLPPVTKGQVRDISHELAALLQEHCQAEVEIHLLNKNNPEVTFYI